MGVINSIVETAIAIICSCMPAFASFARHVGKDSGFLMSLRSVLGRYAPGSSGRSTEKSLGFSHPPSSASDSIQSRRMGPGFGQDTPGNSYIELRDPRGGYKWTAGNYSAHVVHPIGTNDSGPSSYRSGGIAKTVAVEVV